MTKYVENVNTYLSEMKIKQTFISLKSGIETSKLSRILTGAQDINATDMERIATALGQKVEYFLSQDFYVPSLDNAMVAEVAFYAGNPSKQQESFAMKLVDLIENVDEVLGAKDRFMKAIME
ncbi:helix-turn-helix transcriptional regulator [Anaerosporobacter sp.]|uniref:helix-turn-helix transcriptional regulator n=1 Tax=Anaerosporobacter sp. TaxID=1872529 RepID=UPI00286EB872|nr:helix-turn-helix transcriptional regulator [Anaerosporobacter sp.]